MPYAIAFVVCLLSVVSVPISRASDHLDSPAALANPSADIADIYAWSASDGRHLNLIMTLQGHAFSDKIDYVFNIDSGREYGRTTVSTVIRCRFATSTSVNCTLGKVDSVTGDPTNPRGLEGSKHRFRVFAALRDDPFFNNIKGLLGAYKTANEAIAKGAEVDAAGCPQFDQVTTTAIAEQMQHTDGGPAQNFLFNWTVSAIVIAVDLKEISKGGPLLAVWGTTSIAGRPLNRMAQPFVKNTLLGTSPFATDDASGRIRDEFNAADPSSSDRFVEDLAKSLAFQDSLDGKCGNAILALQKGDATKRYHTLAALFANDRLWVNVASKVCTQYFAVELSQLAGRRALAKDCGGRTPNYDTSNVWRSLLIAGTINTITDGLQHDEHEPSSTVFPFLAAPDPQGVNH